MGDADWRNDHRYDQLPGHDERKAPVELGEHHDGSASLRFHSAAGYFCLHQEAKRKLSVTAGILEIQAEFSALSESLCDLESERSQSTFDLCRIR